jgi:voltage-gated potassium channel
MRTDAHPVSEPRPRHAGRRRAAVIVVRSLLVSTVIIVGYFVLPLDSRWAVDTGIELISGLVIIAALLAWQIRAIVRSRQPAAQAVATLGMTVPMFFVLFATCYYLMGQAGPAHFSEALTRLDALYFTITTFATVGFGDIVATSEAARAVVTIQMVLGLILVGLIARVVVAAVQEARNRQTGERTSSEGDL